MVFFAALLLLGATIVLGELLAPKPQIENAKAASLDQFSFPTATEGRAVPIIWGTVKLAAPNCVGFGNFRQKAIKESVRVSLFRKKKVITGYRYFVDMQLAFCRGECDAILRVWWDEKIIWTGTAVTGTSININLPKLFGGDSLGNGGLVGTLKFYMGDETQTADAIVSTYQAEGGDTPAYRGTCYASWSGEIGNSTTVAAPAVEVRRITTALGATNATVNTSDANPAHALYEILTNTKWGMGWPASDIETSTFTDAAATLASEGNGLSLAVEENTSLRAVVREIQDQINGIVRVNPSTGKWELKLIRDDYVLANLPVIDESTLVKLESYTRGSLEDTKSEVKLEFIDRDRDYFKTAATAKDVANQRSQSLARISTITMRGVKNRTLATKLAWRELGQLARPACKAEVIVTGSMYLVEQGDAVLFENARLGVSGVVMRVMSINKGTYDSDQIRMSLAEDIFSQDKVASAAPPDGGWTETPDTLVAIPSSDQVIIEAPRALIDRDPDSQLPNRIWCGALDQGDGAVTITILGRVSPAAYTRVGDIAGFMEAGTLAASLGKNSANPVASLQLTPAPSTKALLLEALLSSNAVEVGGSLVNLLRIGTEFLACQSAQDNGATVQLNNVWRGLLDSAPQDHASSARVMVMSSGGALTDAAWAAGTTVDIKLSTESSSDELAEGSATLVQVTMQNRYRRPYPPTLFKIGAVNWPATTQSLDTATSLGSGIDQVGLEVGFRRKDASTMDEVASVISDTTGLGSNFPAALNTRYRVRAIRDPAGTPVDLGATGFNSGGATVVLTRTKLLRLNAGAIPSPNVELQVETRHTWTDALDYDALQDLFWTVAVSSTTLGSRFNMGVSTGNAASPNAYTAPANGNYGLTLGTAQTSGAIQYRLNGGAWTDVITGTNTTGTIVGVTATDTIELRKNAGASTAQESMVLVAPPSGTAAYWIAAY